jgi:hypothetical protein
MARWSLSVCLVVALFAMPGCAGLRSRRGEAKVNPVGQVITLLDDLVKQTQEEGDAEAKTYEEFSCFCKDTTKEKSNAITDDKDEVDTQAATMEEKDSLRIKLQKAIKDLQDLIAQTDTDMADAQAQRDADHAKYEAKAADLEAAVTGIEGAVSRMEVAEGEVSFPQLKAQMRKSLLQADALGLTPRHARTLAALLQEDGGDDGTPEGDFEFHGSELLDTMGDLAKTYSEKKTQCDEEEASALSAHQDYMAAKTRQKETAEKDLDDKTGDLEDCMKALGEASEALATAKAMLTDDEQYMKDLTAKCELKAKEWDQRSAMRADELTALSKALGIMQDRVKVKDDQANKRAAAALMQQEDDGDAEESEDVDDSSSDDDSSSSSESEDDSTAAADSSSSDDQEQADDSSDDETEDESDDDVSFLQRRRSHHRRVGALLRRAQKKHAKKKKALVQQKSSPAKKVAVKDHDAARDKALELLRSKGLSLKSAVLTSVLMKLSADPFVKVKKLMQDLIEKLVTSASDEATQKGWCDTELGKAESSRDSEYSHASKFNAKIEALEAARDGLSDDIDSLTKELDELNASLEDTTKMRSEEKAENMDTIEKAGEGLDAVSEAIGILKAFYKGAGKAKVLLQVSPVDEAEGSQGTPDGAYQGNQAASGGILGMMAVIKSDFERTIATTKSQEKEAARSFAEFDTTTKASIKSKETSKEMKVMDKSKAHSDINEGMQNLQEHMTLLDDALKQLEDLKPACIDTGMSYDDRVAKREEEIEALKEAMCILDTDGVEGDC